MKRVLLADDHGIVLQGVRRLLEQDGTFVVEAEAQSAREVLRLVAERTFELLVLDLSLLGGGGLEVLGRLRQLAPKVRVVVYSMYPEAQYAKGAERREPAVIAHRRLLRAVSSVAHGVQVAPMSS